MTAIHSIATNVGSVLDGAAHWTTAKLGEVCRVNPPKPKRGTVEPDLPVSFVPMPAVDADAGAITRPVDRPYAEVAKGFTAFRDGDVIMAKITPCMENGKAAIARGLTNGLGFGSTEFHVFRPTDRVLAEYVYYFIRQESFRQAAEMEMTGSVGQKRVPADFIENAEIPLPSLAEQKRIVEAIDRLTARVDAARARLAAVPATLKRFRQAVLAAACSGRLTEDWRDGQPPTSTTPSQHLLARIDAERKALWVADLKQRGRDPSKARPVHPCEPTEEFDIRVPEEWVTVSMERLTQTITSGSRDWKQYYSESGAGTFVMAQNIRPMHFDRRYRHGVNPPHDDRDRVRSEIRKDDVLVTIVGANTGDVCRVPDEVSEHYVCQSVALMRPVLPQMSPWLELWLNSPSHGRAQYEAWIYGEGRPHISFDHLKSTAVALPPLEEQAEIVRRVESLMKLADGIERRVIAAQARADKLTQSILAKAFRGELVPAAAESETANAQPVARAVIWRFEDFAAVQAEIVRRFPNDATLGRKKLFKLSYLAAAMANAKTERPLKQDAAGPYDGKLQADAEAHAASQKWFTANKVAREPGEAHYRAGTNTSGAAKTSKALLGAHWSRFEALLTAAKTWDSNAAELHATTHAAWNALLAEGTTATPEVITARFFAWSPEKSKKFSKWQVDAARQTLATLGLVPTGRCLAVEGLGQAGLFASSTP